MKRKLMLAGALVAWACGTVGAAERPADDWNHFTEPYEVAFGGEKGEDLLVGGRALQIRGGEMHPQRIPRAYWRHRVRMARAMGLNAISVYFFWNGFERPDGTFDFKTDRNDVAAFLRTCQEEGMFVLFRPGPYCCGEWDFGGIPPRLLKRPDARIRTDNDPEYLREALKYLEAIADVAEPFLAKHGGPIVYTQVENEYGSWPDKEASHITTLKNFWKRRGFAPLYMADGPAAPYYEKLPYPDREIAVGLNPGRREKDWDAARKANPGVPILSSEVYPGWLRHWGEGNWSPTDLRETVRWFMDNRKSFCIYVVHGATSFGFTTGANDSSKTGYRADMTSYDYAAPINEQGSVSHYYMDYREIIGKALGGVDRLVPVPEPVPSMDVKPFELSFFADLRDNCERPFTADKAPCFESFDQNQGLAFYSIQLPPGPTAELRFERLSDYAKIFVDGRLLMTVDRRETVGAPTTVMWARSRPVTLTVEVEGMAHINYGKGMKDDRKGIVGEVTLGGVPLRGWQVVPKPLTEDSIRAAKRGARRAHGVGGHFRGTFAVAEPKDTFLDMSRWGKGVLYVNGVNLGRYWCIGPQLSLYCPATVLRRGENQVDVIELDQNEPAPIRGLEHDYVLENGRETRNLDNVWDPIAASSSDAAVSKAKRWYKGETHIHTLVSDGQAFPEEAANLYRACGYNFLMFSDHNRTQPQADRWCTAPDEKVGRFAGTFPKAAPSARRTADGKTEYRMPGWRELQARCNVPGSFLLMNGQESNDDLRDWSCMIHTHCINTSTDYVKATCETPQEMIERNYGSWARNARKEGVESIFAVDHPIWYCFDIDPTVLSEDDRIGFFEICNSGSGLALSPLPDGVGYTADRLWDFALARRAQRGGAMLFGLGSTDNHRYDALYEAIGSGRPYLGGHVQVLSDSLDAAALVRAMKRGDFYASTGVRLLRADRDEKSGCLSVAVDPLPGEKYVIRFLGTKAGTAVEIPPAKAYKTDDLYRMAGKEGAPPWYVGKVRRIRTLPESVGVVLAETEGSEASYRLQDDDLYVRAKVFVKTAAAEPDPEKVPVAWTQPVRHLANWKKRDGTVR